MGTLTYLDENGVWQTTDDGPGSGGGGSLTENSVDTIHVIDGAITNSKIFSVDGTKITGSINGQLLTDRSVTADKLNINSIGWQHLDSFLTGDLQHTQNTADGAHALAIGKNNIYYSIDEPQEPIVGDSFNEGDLWINLGDGKKLYAYNQGHWVLAQDEDISRLQVDLTAAAHTAALSATGLNVVYRQPTMPTGGTYGVGDTWIDPNGPKVYIWDGNEWYHNPVTSPDGSIQILGTGNKAYYQNLMPTGSVYLLGDRWFDAANGDKPYIYTRSGWRTVEDAYSAMAAADIALQAANGKNKTIYSTQQPFGTGFVDGDMWYVTGIDPNTSQAGTTKMFTYDDGAWVEHVLTDSLLGNVSASRITVGVLNGNLIEVNTLDGDRIKTNTLDAAKIIAGSITAQSAIFAEGAIRSAWIGDAQINTAHIGAIDAYKITAAWLDVTGNIKTAALDAKVIDAESIRTGTIASDWGGAIDISANSHILLLARKDNVISYINVSPEAVTISGDKIDINGALTLSNWADASDVTKISGGQIATNSISVNKVTSNFGSGLDISSNTSITSRVTRAELDSAISDVAGIEIGGSNFVVDSGYMFDRDKVSRIGSGYTLSYATEELYNDNVSLMVVGGVAGSASNLFAHSLYGAGIIGKNTMLSFYVKGSVATTGQVNMSGMTTTYGSQSFPVTTGWTRVVLDLGSITAEGTADANTVQMWFAAAGTFYVNSMKLEYGTKETDWSIAPQDITLYTSSLAGRIENAENIISSDQIISRVQSTDWYKADLADKATSSELQAISTLLTTQYSTIEQTDSKIDLSVGLITAELDRNNPDENSTGGIVNNVSTTFSFRSSGLLIGKEEDQFKVNLSNTQLEFLDGNDIVAWVSNKSLFITDAKVNGSLVFGAHVASKLGDNITVFRPA